MKKIKFEVTPNHIKLLKSAYVSWESCEFGAPAIDCKRPYGNSDVYTDIAEIISLRQKNEDSDFTNEEIETMHKTHQETQTVLQIILSTGTMSHGIYERTEYRNDWKLSNQ